MDTISIEGHEHALPTCTSYAIALGLMDAVDKHGIVGGAAALGWAWQASGWPGRPKARKRGTWEQFGSEVLDELLGRGVPIEDVSEGGLAVYTQVLAPFIGTMPTRAEVAAAEGNSEAG